MTKVKLEIDENKKTGEWRAVATINKDTVEDDRKKVRSKSNGQRHL